MRPGKALKATLRQYQATGVNWLAFLSNLGLGACLADDMGLGKTIQVISLLLILKKRKEIIMSSEKKPNIIPTPDGPYLVKNLKNFADQNGAIESKETMALCRCGGSANKPFCDGTHAKIGFSSAKLEGVVEDKRENYKGKKITIHDNRGICAHAGYCTDGLASVFRMKEEPWIQPDAASVDEIIA